VADSLNITIEIKDAAVTAALKKLEAAGQNLAPALDTVGAILQAWVLLGFNTGTAPDGSKWAPLKVRAGQPLRDTGILMGSITYAVDPSPGAASLEVGTNIEYGKFHQLGTKTAAGGTHIPQRAFLPINTLPPDWAADAVDAIERHLANALPGTL